MVKSNINMLCIFFVFLFKMIYAQDYQNTDRQKESFQSMMGLGMGSNLQISQVSESNVLSASINEDEYTVDAGDVFLIKIDVKGPAFKMFNSVVTPDGFLVIPDAPSVYVRHLILSQAKEKINEVLRNAFPDAKVESYLYYVHPIRVTVLGAVPKPLKISLYSNNRLFDAINMALTSTSFDSTLIFNWKTISYRNIDLKHEGNKSAQRFDLLKYKLIGEKEQNPYLIDEDVIFVQYKDSTKYTININGAVAKPLEFEFQLGDDLEMALRFAGGMLPSADSTRIELLRFKENKFDIENHILAIPQNKDFKLNPDDRIYVREKYNYHEKFSVLLEGAVKYPGEYPINVGKTKLTQIIQQAGGFSPKASLRNAKLLRAKNVFEDKELKRLRRMTVEEMNDIEVSYFRLRTREDSRLVSCDFEKLFIENNLNEDVILRDGDIINIPEITKTVFVSGGVVSPGHVTIAKERNYLDYIELAGGFNERAREGSVKIIKNKSGVWLDAAEDVLIEEGDIIFIPESEEIDWYDVFKEGLTILTQVGTVVLIVINLK